MAKRTLAERLKTPKNGRSVHFSNGGIADLRIILCSQNYRVPFGMADKDEIELSTDGKSVTLRGKGDYVSRWGNGLADLFKRFGQHYGEKGDAVEHDRNMKRMIRVFNEEALRRGLQLTLDRADETGVMVKPINPKYLAQWGEAVSLEDLSDADNFVVIYANLLLSASINENPNDLIFLDTIKKLDFAHIDLLEKIAKNYTEHDFHEIDTMYHSSSFSQESMREMFQIRFENMTVDVLEPLTKEALFEHVRKLVGDTFKQGGILVPMLRASHWTHFEEIKYLEPDIRHKNVSYYLQSYRNNNYKKEIVDSLIALNVLNEGELNRMKTPIPGVEISITYIYLTDFGAKFTSACRQG